MDYERFLDSWQYAIKGTPIDNLIFDISVFRASVFDENSKQLVAHRRFIPWAQKVFSPTEVVQLYNAVHSPTGTGLKVEAQLRRLLEPFEGPDLETKMKSYLARNTFLESSGGGGTSSIHGSDIQQAGTVAESSSDQRQQQQDGAGDEQRNSANAAAMQIMAQHQQQQQQRPVNFHIFTRPPSEGFIHPEDAESEIIPPQPPTSLSTSILRPSHEQQSLPSMRTGAEDTEIPTASKESSMFVLFAAGSATQPVEGNIAGLPAKFVWHGTEKVLVQLVKLPDGSLVTRPSLIDEHVLFVNNNYIVTFVVNLSQARDGALALLSGAGKHALASQSVLIDPDEDDIAPPAAVSSSSQRGGGGGSGGNEKSWLALKKNVVQRGVVSELAKRAQSPTAPDSRGNVTTVKMLRQALGIHDPARQSIPSAALAAAGIKTGAEVFGTAGGAGTPKKAKNIVETIVPTIGGGKGGGAGVVGPSSSSETFLAAPPKGTKRVHFFVTLESVCEIERESVFARCSWVFPPAGVALDTEGNRRGGVREFMQVTSQTAYASRHIGENNVYVTKHILNLPIEVHCLMNDCTAVGTPRLVVEVFSGGDGNGHQTLEGYALLTCSPTPGHHKFSVGMWRPRMSGWEMLKSIFIGGSAALVDREAVALPYGNIQLEALNLDSTVRRELAEQMNYNQQVNEAQQQQQRNGDDGGDGGGNMVMTPPRKTVGTTGGPLPEDVERDIALASSVSTHSRAGLLTTSEGCVQASVMCFVQQS